MAGKGWGCPLTLGRVGGCWDGSWGGVGGASLGGVLWGGLLLPNSDRHFYRIECCIGGGNVCIMITVPIANTTSNNAF